VYDLLEVESSLLGLVNPSIDTLTFYEGAPPVEALAERLRLMVLANPWLAGRLLSADKGAVQLWVPDGAHLAACFGACFSQVTFEGLSASTPPQEAIERTAGLGVPLGLRCVDAEEPLFRVSLVTTGEATFALHASLSHVIGDAATFYTLYAMLDPAGPPPRRLDPERLGASFSLDAAARVFGAQFAAGHSSLPSSRRKGIADALRLYEAGSRAPARRKAASLHVIDEAWVARQKQAHVAAAVAAGVEFVSSNDVLASWYYNSAGATTGTLAVDCRGRMAGVPAATAELRPGNYLAPIYCVADEFGSPAAVRHKVADVLRRAELLATAETTARAMPPLAAAPTAPSGGAVRVANVTNWSSAYYHLTFADCRHVAHLPVLNSLNDATHGNLYLFRPRPGVLAALNFSKVQGAAAIDASSPFRPWDASLSTTPGR